MWRARQNLQPQQHRPSLRSGITSRHTSYVRLPRSWQRVVRLLSNARSRRQVCPGRDSRANWRARLDSFGCSRMWWTRARGQTRGLTRRCRSESRCRAPTCAHAAADWASGGVWRKQFSAGVLGGRRRYRFGVGSRQSSDREGAPGTSGHERTRGAGHCAGRYRNAGCRAACLALLFDSGIEVGTSLVQHPAVQAVAFTGSASGGQALMKLAAARPQPIPCLRRNGQHESVVCTARARCGSAEWSWRRDCRASFTLGSGQFCTKPGVVFVPQDGRG